MAGEGGPLAPWVDGEVLLMWGGATLLYTLLCVPRFSGRTAAWLERQMPGHPLNRTWNSFTHAVLACVGATYCMSQWSGEDWACGLLVDAEMRDPCYQNDRAATRLSALFMAHEAGYFLSDSIFMDPGNYRAFLPHHILALVCIASVSTKNAAVGLLPATMLFLPIELGGVAYHLDRALHPAYRSMSFVAVFTLTRILFFLGVYQVVGFTVGMVRRPSVSWGVASMVTLLVVGVCVLLVQNMLWLRQQLLAAREQWRNPRQRGNGHTPPARQEVGERKKQ